MHINDFFVFVKVVQLGSLNKVSKILKIPLSTVSTKIVRLETRLGSPLLIRSTRTLQLTEVGLNYYELVKPIVDQLELIDNNILLQSKEPSGTLKITASEDIAIHILPQIIAKYMRQCPNVKIDLNICNEKIDLSKNDLDLAIRGGTLHDSSLMAMKFFSTTVSIWASPGYLSKYGTPACPEDLKNYEFILFSFIRSQVYELSNCHHSKIISPIGRIVVNSVQAAESLAINGHGLVFLHDFQCIKYETESLLQKVLPDWTLKEMIYYFVFLPQKKNSLKIRRFIEVARQLNSQSKIASGVFCE